MGLRLAFALTTTLLLAACAGSPDSDTNPGGPLQSAEATAAKHKVARELCAAAGFGERTALFAHCVAAQHAREAERLRAHARSLAANAARQHGLCLDPVRFELARCIEI